MRGGAGDVAAEDERLRVKPAAAASGVENREELGITAVRDFAAQRSHAVPHVKLGHHSAIFEQAPSMRVLLCRNRRKHVN